MEKDSKEAASKLKPGDSTSGKPGKPAGAPGFGRTQQLPVTATVKHRPEACVAWGHPADSATLMKAWTGHYTVDIDGGNPGDPSHPHETDLLREGLPLRSLHARGPSLG
jgi:hypothetical protein